MDLPGDHKIITAIRLGDKEALSELYLKYYNHLNHYGIRINNQNELVEECIQELFLYIYEAHERLGMIKNVKAYLFISLRRRILEKLKTQRKKRETEYSIAHRTNIQFSVDEIIFSETDYLNNNTEALLDALNNLPWRQREAIYLRYYNKLSTNEIAQIMGSANQTILNTIHQALKKLRSNLLAQKVD